MSNAFSGADALASIIAARAERIASRGRDQGCKPPPPTQPLPFLPERGCIFEPKRASPSAGSINALTDPCARAIQYRKQGAKALSVLTEEDSFAGSLADLAAIRVACPDTPILRKDFLLDPKDVAISRRFGADAVLVIASLFELDGLKAMVDSARRLGMEALVEAHTPADLNRALAAGARLVGLNARNLSTLEMDAALPLRLMARAMGKVRFVYESGIGNPEAANLAGAAGFHGILVGEALIREPSLGSRLVKTFSLSRPRRFWPLLYSGAVDGSALVKVCGLTRAADVEAAEAAGADALGFVLCPSPRRVKPGFLSSLGQGPVPRIAVCSHAPHMVPKGILDLIDEGALDAIQFHDCLDAHAFTSSLDRSELTERSIPWYKALNPRDEREADPRLWRCPRVLCDGRNVSNNSGGGKPVSQRLAGKLKRPWIAGGLKPASVASAIRAFRPELLDASSGLESSPGIKDAKLIRSFIEEVRDAAFIA